MDTSNRGAWRIAVLSPGILACLAVAVVSTFVAGHYGGPRLLYALLFGMALHFLSQRSRTAPGIAFSGRLILRLGVALLGLRIGAGQIAELGIVPIVIVLAGVTLTILSGIALARMLGLAGPLGVLTGGAVAICGASAALAISAVLPKSPEAERDTLFTVVGVTTLSTAAMVLYPLLARMLGLSDQGAGILLGGTIHDVAQVVGAGAMISDSAATVATYVKLLRVALLVPVVALLAHAFRNAPAAGTGERLPAFLVAFALLAAANSFGLVRPEWSEWAGAASSWCLATAIAALGMKTSLGEMADLGWRPMALMLGETVFLLALVLAAIWLGGVR